MSSCSLDFASKTCTPCRGGVPPMTEAEAKAFAKDLPDWELFDDATKLRRRYKFKDFAESFAFIGKVAELSEAEGHHPDITFGWGYAEIVLFTHKIKGLHENDFIMASKFEKAFRGVC